MSRFTVSCARRWAAILLATAAVLPAQASAPKIVIVPGDPALPALVKAIAIVQGEPAFAGVRFQVVPQALIDDRDVAALADASVVVARHMLGSVADRLGPALQGLRARGVPLYGAGSNADASAKLGLKEDATLQAYLEAGGVANMASMLRYVVARDLKRPAQAQPPLALPQAALWLPDTGELHERFADYVAAYERRHPGREAWPWVGVVVHRGQVLEGSDETVQAVVQALAERKLRAAVVFGFPSAVPVERFLLDARGQPQVSAVAALGMKLGNVPDKIVPVLQKLDVPLVNAITLYKASRAEWEASPQGLDLAERSWQIAGAEFAGMVAPTVIATKERRQDAATGLSYVAEVPVPERMQRLADRVQALVALRTLPDREKRIALIYYNAPPGNHNIGASYLNVMPRSLWQILERLRAEGYDTRGQPDNEDRLHAELTARAVNIDAASPGALAKLVAEGQAVLWPVARYREWFDRLPAKLREPMLQAWGSPESFEPMVWRDRRGERYFVFPVQRYGKLLFAAQPARGWGDVKAQYHDTALPPHHQYLAFYLWLQHEYGAHAMVHVGTHGTHEWLSGKEVGFTEADPGEIIVGAVPQVYPYIVDVVGEGLQAKRRGMAALVSHMTPPFSIAGLDPELAALRGLLDDYGVAQQKSESAAAATLADIQAKAARMGVLKDLGLTTLRGEEDVEALQHHLEEIGQAHSPMGLHTFGVAPPAELRDSTARAIVARQGELSEEERTRRERELSALMARNADAELDALVAALAGRYVAAGPGGDPLRNPAAWPTGRNLYGFDPARLPTPGVYAQGEQLAQALVHAHRKKHGQPPRRLLFNLWSNETMRHEGVLESQVLALLGVKPVWDGFGRVTGIEVIPRAALGRPRVDVTITASGLYRDSLPTLMLLLDRAVSAVRHIAESDEPDNPVRQHAERAEKILQARGVDAEEARRIAAVRVFSQPPGAYGVGLDNVIMASNTWSREAQVIDVYFRRTGHLFGQGFWGQPPASTGDAPSGTALAIDAFKMALDGVQAVLHSRASNLYGTLDNDDVFQAVGGASMAVRQVSGTTPETFMLNLADPRRARQETLDQFMGREMRSRYLNPKWIDAMLKEGYAGARFVHQVVDNLWGWQVTSPEIVDAAKWQAFFETYVQDKHRLDLRRRFREAKNLLAYQALVDRMLVAVNKGYWAAPPEVVAELERVNREVMAEAGVACRRDSCSSEAIWREAQAHDRARMAASRGGYGMATAADSKSARVAMPVAAAAPAMPVTPPQPAATATGAVRGQQLREVPLAEQVQQLIWTYGGLLASVLLAGVGWQAWRTRRDAVPLPIHPSNMSPARERA